MTDTDLTPAPATSSVYVPRKRAGLSGMVLAELRTLAEQVGVDSTPGMRRGDLIAAIKQRQGAASAESAEAPAAPAAGAEAAIATPPTRARRAARKPAGPPAEGGPDAATGVAQTDIAADAQPPRLAVSEATADGGAAAEETISTRRGRRERRTRNGTDIAAAGSAEQSGSSRNNGDAPATAVATGPETRTGGDRADAERNGNRNGAAPQAAGQGGAGQGGAGQGGAGQGGAGEGAANRNGANQNGSVQGSGTQSSGTQGGGEQNGSGPAGRDREDDGGGEGRGRRGGRRFRERRRGRDRGGDANNGQPRDDRDLEVRDDDVLQPVAGILDVLDNYAFVRTSGYLAGSNDVYVSMNLVRKNGLRRGDAITGAVRIAREGEQQQGNRQKFNPLVRIDTINGGDAEAARKRPEFNKLTPLYPNQRLRLETTPNVLTTRVIDLVMPIGKGQRALIVSPPQGRQDERAAGHRERHLDEQPGMPPHGRARRRASGGGHRHAALGQG